jgi:hypothetical protein
MKLYEISQQYRQIISAIEQRGGELDGLEEQLDKCIGDLGEKAASICALIKEANAEAAALKTEEDRIKNIRKSCESRVDRLYKYLSLNTPESGIDAGSFRLTWRKSESVLCQSDLSSQYENFPELIKRDVAYLPDKTAIKAAIKSGQPIPFATIETHNNLQIR